LSLCRTDQYWGGDGHLGRPFFGVLSAKVHVCNDKI
jgi:hypothetical protein